MQCGDSTDGPTIYRSLRILRIPRLDCTIYRRDGFLESVEHIYVVCVLRKYIYMYMYVCTYVTYMYVSMNGCMHVRSKPACRVKRSDKVWLLNNKLLSEDDICMDFIRGNLSCHPDPLFRAEWAYSSDREQGNIATHLSPSALHEPSSSIVVSPCL